MAMNVRPVIWTIGHSNHELDQFAALLREQEIDYVVDVRSYPYSRYAPQFNREHLGSAIQQRGIGYLFLGDALGGRPDADDHYDENGHALYGPMAAQPAFEQAILRLLGAASEHRLAVTCSCGQPVDCHRRLLVGKVLCERGAELRHILRDGSLLVEHNVMLDETQPTLFGDDAQPWRSAQSVSHRQRLKASSPA